MSIDKDLQHITVHKRMEQLLYPLGEIGLGMRRNRWWLAIQTKAKKEAIS